MEAYVGARKNGNGKIQFFALVVEKREGEKVSGKLEDALRSSSFQGTINAKNCRIEEEFRHHALQGKVKIMRAQYKLAGKKEKYQGSYHGPLSRGRVWMEAYPASSPLVNAIYAHIMQSKVRQSQHLA